MSRYKLKGLNDIKVDSRFSNRNRIVGGIISYLSDEQHRSPNLEPVLSHDLVSWLDVRKFIILFVNYSV